MMYLIYDDGQWAQRLNQVLIAKSQAGVKVRIMADLLGTICDHPTHLGRNLRMIKELKSAGIEVNLFHPNGGLSTSLYRLHFKMCAIDRSTVFIGGSNIGDYYTKWQDSNLRIDGQIGASGHDLYDYIAARSTHGRHKYRQCRNSIDPANLWFGDAKVLLTLPGDSKDIRHQMLDLLGQSEGVIYFRHWYFLPNKDFLEVMLAQLAKGVKIKTLLSDRTRVRLVDIGNQVAIKKLVRAGARIFRYNSRYMHSKITWNENGRIIFGSCNLEEKGLSNNYELCVQITDRALANNHKRQFQRDCAISADQTPHVVKKRPVLKQALSHVCALATPLL